MKAKTSKLLSKEDAAKQVRNLLNAVAEINGIKCPLSTKQIMMIIDGIDKYQKIYISKFWGKVTFNNEDESDEYITIRISRWFEEDKFIIDLN